MSFETIRIYRDLPVINSYVQVPPNKESDKTRITREEATTLISGSAVVRLTGGSGPQNGKYGQQEFVRLPGITPDGWYDTDPVAAID